MQTALRSSSKEQRKSDEGLARELLVVDLFAGAGGFSLGAIDAGFRVVAALELDRHAAATYRKNISKRCFPHVQMVEEDIIEYGPDRFMQDVGLERGECTLLLGGPPCQGFSEHRLNESGVDDPRNALLLRYFDYVRAIEPAFFLIENVPGLLRPKHSTYLNKLYAMADEAGYELAAPVTLNARDFGVPQNRKRVFILGRNRERVTRDLNWPPLATHKDPRNATHAKLCWQTAERAFEPAPVGDPNSIHMNSGPEVTSALASTPHNGGSRHQSGRELDCHKGHDGHKDVYGRIDPSKPGPTMTTACINPSKGRFSHPTENHGITVRQAARLQTFPDNFVFEGGLMASGKQVGNAVPVELARALCDFLRLQICEKYLPELGA